MLSLLAHRVYRQLFWAQVVASLGSGLATIALGLLAYEIAGDRAGEVLGIALALKMVAYISVAPIVGAFAPRLRRRPFLIGLNLSMAAVAMFLPFVTEAWQIYLQVFILQSLSAAFTPAFQATIPDILPEEGDYTRALSLSRLAYDVDSLFSPVLAAALLSIISFHWLFSGAFLGFLASALLISTILIPEPKAPAASRGSLYARTTRGLRIYLETPRLRGLLAITLAAAAASSIVIVNTVVIVRQTLGRDQTSVALMLVAYGGGSMLAALALPRWLERWADRALMVAAAASLSFTLALIAVLQASIGSDYLFATFFVGWFALGFAYSISVTPSGRLLRRSADPEDWPPLFAAQFALCHSCWLLAYPLAGWLGSTFGQFEACAGMALLAGAGATLAWTLWPPPDLAPVSRACTDLP